MGMEIPNDLKHKPIYIIKNYEKVDGIYANNTDVQGMSIGKAQWLNDKDEFVPSVKVWRHTGERWSRQSEEITLTRAIDMSIFIIRILNQINNDFNDNNINIGDTSVSIMKQGDERQLIKYINKNMHIFKKHVNSLSDELKKYLKNIKKG